MTKVDFIAKVAEDTEVSKKVVETVLSSVLDNIKSVVAEDDSITFLGFGTFSVTERAARAGRNPQTGKIMEIPAKKVPKFKPSKAFKDVVAG